jgi:hypothetical protein
MKTNYWNPEGMSRYLDDGRLRCEAPLPLEPGPMCARPKGHEGPHVSASGLWVWDDERVPSYTRVG